MSITLRNLHDLERRWGSAEIDGDTAALDAIAVEDFTLVGPAGFVLTKQQWLGRYHQGDLITRALSFEDTTTRVYAGVAVTIGRHVQAAEYRGHPASGEFRATHIAVQDGSEWRLAGVHLSPIAGPPRVPHADATTRTARRT
jgi:hypothetical protein